jgi:hypothetical protein
VVLFSLQLVLAAAACFGLFHLWRAALPSQRWLQWVVAAGFLVRAVGGQVLFWISWARLPVARRLQLGEGMWFFAIDGANYYRDALAAATHGFGAILALDRTAQSVMFTQTLASAIWLFGRTSSVGLLLNLACYLGMIAILVRWAAREPQTRTAAAVAIIGISLSPSALLWSLQPLKDTFFQFLFVAFVAACAAWQRAWMRQDRPAIRLVSGILMIILLPALSAIRWYFGFALLIAGSLFLLLVAIRSAGRTAVSLAAAAVVVFLLSRGLVIGAGPYLPDSVAGVLTPKTAPAAVTKLPESLAVRVEDARSTFDRIGGQTSIKPAATAVSVLPAAKPLPVPVAAVAETPPPAAETPPPVAAAVTTTSRIKRLSTGIAVLTIPRSIGEFLGMFHIGGGRGMLWFTEIDTLVFDVVLLFAAYVLVRYLRASARNPLVWLVLLTTLLVALPLAYTVTNFGTLFRLREMIYSGLLLMPVAVMTGMVREIRDKRSEIRRPPDL